MTKRITPLLAGVYWVAQFLGGLIAAALLTWLVPNAASDPVKLGTEPVGPRETGLEEPAPGRAATE